MLGPVNSARPKPENENKGAPASAAPRASGEIVRAENLCKSFGSNPVLRGASFSVMRGEIFGIIGPNGSGKSTLLGLISGVEKPDSGTVLLDGKPVRHYSRKGLAQWLAVLRQEPLPAAAFTVREVVEMGRFPHQNWLGGEPDGGEERIEAILRRLELSGLAGRTLAQLSGGERQRAALGKVMAQDPRLLLLDEPTTYLDIGHQIQLMDKIKQWQRESDLTVVAVLHDLNLAALYCDRLMLMHRGKTVCVGTPGEILRSDLIAEAYGTEPIVIRHPAEGVPQIVLQKGESGGLGTPGDDAPEKRFAIAEGVGQIGKGKTGT